MSEGNVWKLRSCIELLDLYEKPLRESLEDGEQLEEPPAVMLRRGFAFGRATLDAMAAVAERNARCGVCLPTLCRPFYELTARVLWASRELGGWQRLQADCANEHKKWAKRAVEIPSWSEGAQHVLDNAESVLGRTDSKGNRYKMTPDMNKMLLQFTGRRNTVHIVKGWVRSWLSGVH